MLNKLTNWVCGVDNKVGPFEGDHSAIACQDFDGWLKEHPGLIAPNDPLLIARRKTQDDVLNVKIQGPGLNIDKIVNYASISQIKSFEFRPQTWDQFIGQSQAKQRVNTIIKQFNAGMRSHIILSAIRGHGKTSYIELLAKTLDAHLIQRIGHHIDEYNLVDIINEINTVKNKNVVFFIDEIDSMDKHLVKTLNSIIESFQIAGKKIKPFLFACATINKDKLIKNNPDTLDRIQHHVNFNRYTLNELATIIGQYHQQLYSGQTITEEIIEALASNSKYNPRTAINLLEFFVVENDIKKVFQDCCIVKDGLTLIDIKILNALNEAQRPLGANALAMKCGMCEKEYVTEWEPFLYEFGYIGRVPSRIITEKGKEFLKGVKTGI